MVLELSVPGLTMCAVSSPGMVLIICCCKSAGSVHDRPWGYTSSVLRPIIIHNRSIIESWCLPPALFMSRWCIHLCVYISMLPLSLNRDVGCHQLPQFGDNTFQLWSLVTIVRHCYATEEGRTKGSTNHQKALINFLNYILLNLSIKVQNLSHKPLSVAPN